MRRVSMRTAERDEERTDLCPLDLGCSHGNAVRGRGDGEGGGGDGGESGGIYGWRTWLSYVCHMYIAGSMEKKKRRVVVAVQVVRENTFTARQSVQRTLYTTRMWARRVYNHIFYSYTTYKCQINPASPGSPVGPAPLACSSLQSPQPRTLRPGSHTPVAIVFSQQCSHPCKTVSTDLVKRKHQVQFTDVLEKRICTYFASQLPNIATSPIPG